MKERVIRGRYQVAEAGVWLLQFVAAGWGAQCWGCDRNWTPPPNCDIPNAEKRSTGISVKGIFTLLLKTYLYTTGKLSVPDGGAKPIFSYRRFNELILRALLYRGMALTSAEMSRM